MNDCWYIYALADPRTSEVRYVGATNNPRRRYTDHLNENNRKEVYKHRWISGLRGIGMRPRMLILEEGKGSRVEPERWWIDYFRKQGARLTNLTIGGEGAPGYNPPSETRQRMSRSAKARQKPSAETRERIGAALRGRKRTPEVVAKAAAARTPHRWTEEERARLSAAVTGFRHTDTARQKIRAAGMGRVHSQETRAAISAQHKGKTLSPEHRKKLSEAKKGKRMSEEQKEHRRVVQAGIPQRCSLCHEYGHKRTTCPGQQTS